MQKKRVRKTKKNRRQKQKKTRYQRRQRGGTNVLGGTTMTPDPRINTPGLNNYVNDPTRIRMNGGSGLGFFTNIGTSAGAQTMANQLNAMPTAAGLSMQVPPVKAMI